ncbi:MAG: hypothetical protein E6F99_14330 [Actinobacteria bacterium]|nr:MAG: hypothetical protein E6F99_14330 [Actinomycetota bacterium]
MAQTHRTSGGGTQRVTGWVGWVLFAAVIMFTAGFINIIEGLVALFKDDYYQVRPSGLVLKVDYTTWGWTLLIFGAVLVVVGYGVAVGQTWARVTGVVLAALNAVVNLGFIAAYPIWVVLVISLDVIVIYALIVHGREAKVLRQ